MRDHPDLAGLEPAILDVAAQMSHESHDLAEVYSDEAVTRAKDFLKQRQEETDRFVEQLSMAEHATDELRRWSMDLKEEDETVAARLEVLEKDLAEILPNIGLDLNKRKQDTVVRMKTPAKKAKNAKE